MQHQHDETCLWGTNKDEPVIVGDESEWHFRAQPGSIMPYWSLYNGTEEVGLEVYPIHEQKDWPDILSSMIWGLNKNQVLEDYHNGS